MSDSVIMADDLTTEEKVSSRTRSKLSNIRGSTSPKINILSKRKSKLRLEEVYPQFSEIFKYNKESTIEIREWYSANNKNIIYVSPESITAKKLYELCDRNIWLSSDHINAYLSYLSMKFSHVFSLPSFFYTKLTTTGRYEYSSVIRWTKKTAIFQKEIIFVPIILDESHWILAAIFMKDQRIAILDSLGILSIENSITIGRNLVRWLNDEYHSKYNVYEEDECKNYKIKGGDPDTNEINQSTRSSTIIGKAESKNQINFELDIMFQNEQPPQMDGSSCGVFVCMFARLMAENIERDKIKDIANLQEANKRFKKVMCTELWEYAKKSGQVNFEEYEDS
ncbi:cysteine proteinase [Rhizophagus irregularis]|uniref:Cysteine proteinase n=3 Tax=Rhizophagus irregularis TaxID=588596 RepID=A0A2I1ETS9_9GLOM|nr:Ulp1p [Rhizophagus irregularis DAOM 197198w]PKC06719.1 cysteine proteinase [Rhizophagus irregularis]GBC39652.2 sentrin-specific protease 2 isoform X2 [Rhizophagus irregularis DAOM 181602=DAOM 197198]PKC75934.1 cysteine proteinase [Rhizophagus irregularis]PKY25537.1 cysteine proteinase [Rhizophagus irregularis]